VRSDKALRSFFGARVGGQNRPQDVNTPQHIVDAISWVWPEGIALDPCSNATSIVPAARRIILPEDGLAVDWPDRTYANPPFGTLKEWLPKGAQFYEHLILAPVRTHRVWWCSAAVRTSRICWLRPFAFLGEKHAFPAPLAMFYFGIRTYEFERAFMPLGYVGVWIC